MRVVSLVPSATELVLAITGRADHSRAQLVGRSHECDWPSDPCFGLQSVPVLTGAATTFETSAQVDADVRARLQAGESLYSLDSARLAALRPDLIITQDLCSVCSIDLESVRQVAETLTPRPQILSLNPATLEDVFDDLLRIGLALGMEQQAVGVLVSLRERMYRAADVVPSFGERASVAFLEWTDPLFVGGHWTPQLIERAGGEHPLNPTVPVENSGAAAGPIGETMRRAGKSITVTGEVLRATRPEYLFVAPCGVSLEVAEREMRKLEGSDWFEALPAVRAARVRGGNGQMIADTRVQGGVWCVDGNQMFNRPGPRLVDAFEFLCGALNDRRDLIPAGFPAREWRG